MASPASVTIHAADANPSNGSPVNALPRTPLETFDMMLLEERKLWRGLRRRWQNVGKLWWLQRSESNWCYKWISTLSFSRARAVAGAHVTRTARV